MAHRRFGVRDLLWAMVVVGMGVGWWVDRSQVAADRDAAIRELPLDFAFNKGIPPESPERSEPHWWEKLLPR